VLIGSQLLLQTFFDWATSEPTSIFYCVPWHQISFISSCTGRTSTPVWPTLLFCRGLQGACSYAGLHTLRQK